MKINSIYLRVFDRRVIVETESENDADENEERREVAEEQKSPRPLRDHDGLITLAPPLPQLFDCALPPLPFRPLLHPLFDRSLTGQAKESASVVNLQELIDRSFAAAKSAGAPSIIGKLS